MTMNKTNIKIAEQYEKTAKMLLEKAKLLKTGISLNQCIHGKYTHQSFTGCKTCGSPKVVICNHKKVIGKRRNSKGCNPANCKYFKTLTVGSEPENRLTAHANS